MGVPTCPRAHARDVHVHKGYSTHFVCVCLRGKKRVGNGICPLTRRVEANAQSILIGHLCTINPLAKGSTCILCTTHILLHYLLANTCSYKCIGVLDAWP